VFILGEKMEDMLMVYDRDYWLETMIKIANPVLTSLSKRELKSRIFSMENNKRERYMPLEMFSRTLCGMAPWLSLDENEIINEEERKLKKKFLELAQQSLDAATNPESSNYMNFSKGDQPLVDTAFLAQAIVRAPKELFFSLGNPIQSNLIKALKESRKIKPYYNNWVLFPAMIEAALYLMGETYDPVRIDYALKQLEQWYKGDGIYGDGPFFQCDYYNSFVIHPMLIDILEIVGKEYEDWNEMKKWEYKRAGRYSEILERMISPEGTFPPIGRSLTYRFGVFHALSHLALHHNLPQKLIPAQVRCALTSVIKNIIEKPGVFDEEGWLTVGFTGYQPSLGEAYISKGSVYLCMCVFLPLGLPPTDSFWSGTPKKWSSLKIWSGEDFERDVSLK